MFCTGFSLIPFIHLRYYWWIEHVKLSKVFVKHKVTIYCISFKGWFPFASFKGLSTHYCNAYHLKTDFYLPVIKAEVHFMAFHLKASFHLQVIKAKVHSITYINVLCWAFSNILLIFGGRICLFWKQLHHLANNTINNSRQCNVSMASLFSMCSTVHILYFIITWALLCVDERAEVIINQESHMIR